MTFTDHSLNAHCARCHQLTASRCFQGIELKIDISEEQNQEFIYYFQLKCNSTAF